MNRSIGLLVAGALAVPACGQASLDASYAGRSRSLLRPVVGAPPTVVEPGTPLTLEVLVGPGVSGAELVLSRQGEARPRTRPMRRAAERKFDVEVPSADLAPGRYTYSVRAAAPGGPVESITYDLLVTAQQLLEPVTVPMRRGTFLATSWGSGGSSLGREGGEESATTVPAAVVAVGPDEIAVADTVNTRIVYLGRGGEVRREVDLPDSARVEHLAYETGSQRLLALDPYHEMLWTIDGPEVEVDSVQVPGDPEDVVDLVLGPPYESRSGAVDQPKRVLYTVLEPQLHSAAIAALVDGAVESIPNGDGETLDDLTVPGIPTDVGAFTVSIDRRIHGIGLQQFDPLFGDGDPMGLIQSFQVPFLDRVLDVTPVAAEPSGVVALLVATLGADGAVHDQLLYVNTVTGTARIAEVTETQPGDVSRRIATTSSGVVIFTEQGDAPFFAEYTAEEGA